MSAAGSNGLRKRTLIRYVVPSMMSNLCFFLFTVIDGIFVGQGVGTNAVGAVNLILPFLTGSFALFTMAAVGGGTITAIRIGRGDIEGANKAFMHAFYINTVFCLLLFAAGVFFTGPLCSLMGAKEPFHSLAADYLFWYSVFIIPAGYYVLFQGFCRNDNAPGIVGVSVVISTAFNIFGDWLFIFPLGMGLKGAAVATGLAQCIGLAIVLPHILLKKGRLRLQKVKCDPALVKKVFVRGFPEGVAELASSVSTLCLNLVIVKYIGTIGVNAFAIINYVASFSMAVFYGTGEGLQPLFGQSFGAKKSRDLKYYFRWGVIINIAGSLLLFFLLLAVGRTICTWFAADAETLSFTLRVMPKYAFGFVIAGLNIIISTFLYSTKRSKQALVINLLRSFLVNSVVILFLPLLFGPAVIWWTFCIYEAAVLIVSLLLLKDAEKKRRLAGLL